MNSPCALWYRNILPVALLRLSPALEIMQPWSPKNSRWVVVHDHTVVDIGSGVSNPVWILSCCICQWIISFASFFLPTREQSRYQKFQGFCRVIYPSVFLIFNGGKHQPASFKKAVSLVLFEALDKIFTTPKSQKHSGWIEPSRSMDPMCLVIFSDEQYSTSPNRLLFPPDN